MSPSLSFISAKRAAIADLPLDRARMCGMHICRLLVAMRQTQKKVMASPGEIFPLPASLTLYQNPQTNMAMMANCARAVVAPQIVLRVQAIQERASNVRVMVSRPKASELKALTMKMEVSNSAQVA